MTVDHIKRGVIGDPSKENVENLILDWEIYKEKSFIREDYKMIFKVTIKIGFN